MRLFGQTKSRRPRYAAILSCVLASAAAPGGAMAITPVNWPIIEGRWIEDAATAKQKGTAGRVGFLDITYCDDGICLMEVSAAGECGKMFGRFDKGQLQPAKATGKYRVLYRGSLNWPRRRNLATIRLSEKDLRLNVVRPDSLSSHVTPSYFGKFARTGNASCAWPAVQRLTPPPRPRGAPSRRSDARDRRHPHACRC
jgi:hypothetical protein